MKSYSDRGIIIKLKSIGEADKLVVIVSAYHGTISAIAKGASRSKSKKGSTLDTLNLVKCSFYSTKGLDLLKEVELINDYNAIKTDKEIVNKLLYILEIIQKLNVAENEDAVLFELLQSLLDELINHKEFTDFLIAVFELKLLDLAGLTPDLINYVNNNELILENQFREVSKGETLGYKFTTKSKQSIPDTIIKIQKYLISQPFGSCLKLKLSDDQKKQLVTIHRFWIESIVENRLKSTLLLKK